MRIVKINISQYFTFPHNENRISKIPLSCNEYYYSLKIIVSFSKMNESFTKVSASLSQSCLETQFKT